MNDINNLIMEMYFDLKELEKKKHFDKISKCFKC